MLCFAMPYVPVILPDRMAAEIERLAREDGCTRSDTMRSLLRDGLAARRQAAPDRVTPPMDARSNSPRTK